MKRRAVAVFLCYDVRVMGKRVTYDKKTVAVLLWDKEKRDWVDRSSAVTAVYTAYKGKTQTGYNVYFRGAKQSYFYTKKNVRFVRKSQPKPSSTTKSEPAQSVHRSQVVQPPKRKNPEEAQVKLIQRYTNYFRSLAAYAKTIAEADTPLFFLAQNYERMVFLKDSVIHDLFLGRSRRFDDDGWPIIAPFVFNQSQLKAIEKALSHSVSVIEGPPGTGKTQTILNLITNLLIRGKSCAVVSNNNTAIDNVLEKFQETEFSFLLARLGNRANVEAFFADQETNDLKKFLKKSKKPDVSLIEITSLHAMMKRILEAEVTRSELDELTRSLELELAHHKEGWTPTRLIKDGYSAQTYLNLTVRLQEPRKIRFFERWRMNRRFKFDLKRLPHALLLDEAEHLYYTNRLAEVTKERSLLDPLLEESYRKEIEGRLQELSEDLLTQTLDKHYREFEPNAFTPHTFKRQFNRFLARYPVILSTSQSLLNNVPSTFTFDYLIIDEASQGDLLSSVLALNHAKNVVIIGDSKQLEQIEEEVLFKESEKLAREYEIPYHFRYEANSILTTTKRAISSVPTTLLREHYRCAPVIINFCNQMFYDNQLIVMTKNDREHIQVIKTVEGNHAYKNPYGSGLYNQREIDEVGKLLTKQKSSDVGIIAPFRYQADLLQRRYGSATIEADTIHRFQGREKNEIILSFTVNGITTDEEDKVSDFVTNHQLLNVAISRAKKQVTAVVSHKLYHSRNNPISAFIRYAEYHYGAAKESSVTSVFDLLHSDYSKAYLQTMHQHGKLYILRPGFGQ